MDTLQYWTLQSAPPDAEQLDWTRRGQSAAACFQNLYTDCALQRVRGGHICVNRRENMQQPISAAVTAAVTVFSEMQLIYCIDR